jgi:ribose transport system permease protein
MNVLEQLSVLGLVAAGATIMIISGNFDISVASIIGLSCCLMAIALNKGFSEISTMLLGIAVCVGCTVANGALSIFLNAPSFIISLATTGVFGGIALYITQGVIVTIYGQFEFFSATKLFGFMPLLFVISITGSVITHFILQYTQLGRRVFALGNNPNAAFLAGININRNKLGFFALNGIFVGTAAVLLLSRLGSALPSTGSGLEMNAIGSVVIGGAPINGGRGKIVGTFFGVLLMGLISNALNMLHVNPFLQRIATGSIIILAIAISSLRTKFSFGYKRS